MDSISALISSFKVILISAGAVSLAMAIKFSLPASLSEAPVVWSVSVPWTKTLYLYIIVNGIIIIIVALSRFHQIESDPPLRSERLVSVRTPLPADFASLTAETEVRTVLEAPQTADAKAIVVYGSEDSVLELRPVMVNGLAVGTEAEEETEPDAQPEAEAEPENLSLDSDLPYDSLSKEKFPPELRLEYLLSREKPLVSSSSESTAEEMRSLTEAELGTMESTWKMIMEGSHAPLKEDLKSPDAWGRHVRKSQTFKDRKNHHESPPRPARSRSRKELSPSQDEWNRRYEAFIKKTYEEMRLQRQESLEQHMQMMNGGV